MLKQLYRTVLPPAVRDRIHPYIHPRMKFVEWRARKYASGVVQKGPFRGMRVPDVLGPHLLPLALGLYELELHPAFERLSQRKFSTVLDVGGGVGYYAVGCALWQPAKVVAWEADEALYHLLIKALADANGVEIDIRGFCNTAELKPFSMKDTLLIMDIEGYEAVLLDPDSLPNLRHATMIVEFHPNIADNCREMILERFGETHTHIEYQPRHRTAEDYPIRSISKNPLLRRPAELAVIERPTWREGRHGWLLFEPI